MSIVLAAIAGVAEGKGLELHARRHVKSFYLFVNHTRRLYFYLYRPVAVKAVLAGAGVATLDSCCETGAILFITFCLLAGAGHPSFFFPEARAYCLLIFEFDAFTTAVPFETFFFSGSEAGTAFKVAVLVAGAHVVQLVFGLVRKTVIDWLLTNL